MTREDASPDTLSSPPTSEDSAVAPGGASGVASGGASGVAPGVAPGGASGVAPDPGGFVDRGPGEPQDAVVRVLRSGIVRTFWMLLGLFGLLECIPLVTGDQPWPAVPAPLLLVAGGALALRASRSSLPDDTAQRLAVGAAASSLTGLAWFTLAVALWA